MKAIKTTIAALALGGMALGVLIMGITLALAFGRFYGGV